MKQPDANISGDSQSTKTGFRISVSIAHWRQFPVFGDEPDGEGVDAVTGVLIREAFAFEDVAQVTAAVGADYLRVTPVRILMTHHTARVFFIEAGPTAALILNLASAGIKWVVAAPANKCARRKTGFGTRR